MRESDVAERLARPDWLVDEGNGYFQIWIELDALFMKIVYVFEHDDYVRISVGPRDRLPQELNDENRIRR